MATGSPTVCGTCAEKLHNASGKGARAWQAPKPLGREVTLIPGHHCAKVTALRAILYQVRVLWVPGRTGKQNSPNPFLICKSWWRKPRAGSSLAGWERRLQTLHGCLWSVI